MSQWHRIPFSEAVIHSSAGKLKIPESEYLQAGSLPIVDQGSRLIAGYTNDLGAAYGGRLPVVIFGDHTRNFKFVDFPFAIGADGVKVLQPSAHLHCKYLYYFLSSLDIPSAGYSRHFKFLKEFEVICPPMSAQIRIAAALDSASDLIAKRQESVSLIDEAATSMFYETFGSPLANPKGWQSLTIDEIGRVITGNTPSRSDTSNYGDGIEWIKSDNIDSGSVFLTPAAERLSERGASLARIAEPGSVLVTCIAGSPRSIGNVAIANRRVAFNQQINAITPYDMNPVFLYMQLRVAKPLVQEKSTGGMKGLVSKSRFESILLIAPPTELQHEFARRVRALYEQRDSYFVQMRRLEYFFAALRGQAFDCELNSLDTANASGTSDNG